MKLESQEPSFVRSKSLTMNYMMGGLYTLLRPSIDALMGRTHQRIWSCRFLPQSSELGNIGLLAAQTLQHGDKASCFVYPLPGSPCPHLVSGRKNSRLIEELSKFTFEVSCHSTHAPRRVSSELNSQVVMYISDAPQCLTQQ